MAAEKKKKSKRIGRPCAFLYYAACLIMWPVYKIRYGLRIDRSGLRGMKGPALVLCQHQSNKDYVLTSLTLFPHRPNYVASEHFLQNRMMARIFRWMHVITKKMFCTDASTILKIVRARRESNIIVLFPEGRLPAHGISAPVAEGTAELIQKLGIDVYMIRMKGAYLTFPKWSSVFRPGRIVMETSQLFRAGEVATCTREDIDRKLQESFRYNDEKAMAGIRYKARNTADGVDGILWKCPSCGEDYKLKTGGSHIRCECGMDCVLNTDYTITGGRFSTITDWFNWQCDEFHIDTDGHLKSAARIETMGEDGLTVQGAGQADIYIDRNHFTMDGVFLGDPVHLDIPVSQIGGFPVTVHKHFDLYDKGRPLYIYPEPNPKSCMQWVAFLDRAHEISQ